MEGGAGEGTMPPPQKFFKKFYAKIMHFGALFSLVLRCIQSIEGAAPLNPPLFCRFIRYDKTDN